MGWLVDRLASFFLPAAIAVSLLLCIALGIQTVRVSSLKADLAGEQRDRAQETAERERIAREATAKIAKLQADHAAATVALADVYQQDVLAQKARADSARLGIDELQRAIDTFAAARDRTANPDPAPACDSGDKSATLGRLLGRTFRLAERRTGDAERHASEVRALKAQIRTDRLTCQGERQ